MTGFLKKLTNYFTPSAKANAGQATTVHEWLTRNTEWSTEYNRWKKVEGEVWMDRIRTGYNVFRAGLDPQDEGIDFLSFRTTAGLVIHFQNESISASESAFVMEAFKDKVVELGYVVKISDRIIRQDSKIEKHYLKAPVKRKLVEFDDFPAYGNVTIELFYKKNLPVTLQCLSTYYNDRVQSVPENVFLLFEDIVR